MNVIVPFGLQWFRFAKSIGSSCLIFLTTVVNTVFSGIARVISVATCFNAV